MKLIICAYCGSALKINDFGRCKFCNGAYQPIEGTIPYKPPVTFAIPTMDSFIDDMLKTKSLGIISGLAYTGKTSILLDIAEKVKNSSNLVFIAGGSRLDFYPKDINPIIARDIEKIDISQYDTVLIDDFKFGNYNHTRNYPGFVYTADKYYKIIKTFCDKSVITTMNYIPPYLRYSTKFIANLERYRNDKRKVTFEQWPGKKTPYTIEMEIIRNG